MVSSEEIALRHTLDIQLACIDGLLERVAPIEVADDTELLVAGDLVDRVAEDSRPSRRRPEASRRSPAARSRPSNWPPAATSRRRRPGWPSPSRKR